MPPVQVISTPDNFKHTRVNLDSWGPPVGQEQTFVPDSEFIFYTEEMMTRGDKEWPPTIQTYHGHFIPFPNAEFTYIGRGRTFLKLLVSFKQRVINRELGLLEEHFVYTVPAWQGDNNFIHLLELLPHETELDVDIKAFLDDAESIDEDYLARMRKFYSDEEITELAPELFFYTDPVALDRQAKLTR